MRKLLIVLLLAALWSACSREHPEKIAAQAAKECYDLLLDGKYDEFIARKANTDSIPASYREQLVANMKMFADQMQQEHHGMKEVRIVNCTADTARHSANVFLIENDTITVSDTITPPTIGMIVPVMSETVSVG